MKKKVQTSYKASEPILGQNATPLIMAVANEELKKRDGSTLGSITTHCKAYTFPERPTLVTTIHFENPTDSVGFTYDELKEQQRQLKKARIIPRTPITKKENKEWLH